MHRKQLFQAEIIPRVVKWRKYERTSSSVEKNGNSFRSHCSGNDRDCRSFSAVRLWGLAVGSRFSRAHVAACPSFFLAPLAFAGSIRWNMSGSFSHLERAIAYVLSAAMVASTVHLYMSSEGWPEGIQDWLSFVVPPVTLFLGAYFLIKNSRSLVSREFNLVLAMEIAYLSNGLLCLITFFGEWQVGAYFALVAVSAFIVQIALVSVQQARFGSQVNA
ncbi:MAG TPA: hypothetical protein VKV95_14235 [Terriglobia bacterium]|nr:hypothetical protein [Terriglobia bacterium]